MKLFNQKLSEWNPFRQKLFNPAETYISENTKFYGDIEASADMTVDGEVSGTIKSTERVMLGATSRFEGSIESESVEMRGYTKGSVVASRSIEAYKPATIIGDLMSALIHVQSGVIVHGKIVSRPDEQKGLLSAVASAGSDKADTPHATGK